MTTCNDTWHIFYKDIDNDDNFWHLYDDFVDAPVFKTRSEASSYVELHRDEFDGCIIKIAKNMSYI